MHPKVSVVIIGRNEPGRLADCFASVRPCLEQGKVGEVIYVDSASSDNSLEIARQHGISAISLAPSFPNAAVARNAGWRKSSSDLILFLDGDTTFCSGFLKPAVERMDDPNVAVVAGVRREKYPDSSLYIRLLELDGLLEPGPAKEVGGDVLVRRSALEAINGYDESLIACEDIHLAARIVARGWQIYVIDAQITSHDLAITRFSQYWRRCVRSGFGNAEISARLRSEGIVLDKAKLRKPLFGALFLALLAGIILMSDEKSTMLVISLGLVILIVARTAFKNRRVPVGLATLLCYGMHSHFAKIPISVGIFKFYLSKISGRRQGLMEYKVD